MLSNLVNILLFIFVIGFLTLIHELGHFLAAKLVKMADIQRLDIGIAMCHWELGANEMGLQGNWVVAAPSIENNSSMTEYIVSWKRG